MWAQCIRENRGRMRRPVMLAAVLAAVAAGGCASNPAPVNVRGSTLTLRVGEYDIRPQVVRVHAGPLQIVVHDVGVLTHDVHVLGQPTDVRGPSFDYGGTPSAHPGDTVRTPAPLVLAPGRYQLVDTISDYATLGTTGTLIVSP
jgi:hypothetical protein